MEQIFGYIERIVFQHPDNGFTVARLKQPRKTDLTTVVGPLPSIQPGESVRLLGKWDHHPTHGAQFTIQTCHIERPTDPKGIQKYLESGSVRGIGPIYAARIVKTFGEKTLDIIDQAPDRLMEVEGIGEKRVEKIKTCWQEQQTIREVMLFLQKYGVSPSFAQKIFRIYNKEAIVRIQENPYALARDIRGIGFKTADAIAERLGIPKDATQRLDAGLEYLLFTLTEEGHTCYPEDELCVKGEEILQHSVKERICVLIQEERIVRDEGKIWLKGLWLSEKGIAREYNRLLSHPSKLRAIDCEKAIVWAQERLHIELAPSQKQAVMCSLTEKVHIITGGPGTGKSTITKAILAVTEKLTSHLILAAPTGRAAKRMTEITGKSASTLHSLLQYDFGAKGFRRNRENPLVCDFIVIDEASMIDTHLMYHLLKAIPDHARLLIVGDSHQLPSVGPGNVLKDLIASKLLVTTELTEIFRQAKNSRIITNAHLINQGVFPSLTSEKNSDFFFVKAEEPEVALEKILMLVSQRLPKYYRLNPIEDIQVLSPMKRGVIGIEQLNHALQRTLNPQEDVHLQGGKRFGVGDKVIQTKNDYTKEVFNGDIGRILKIDREEDALLILFDGKEVLYPFADLDELSLAYAISVHKYQGSESPCVVIPVHTTHFMMLHRNLLYTAVTRGKRLVVLVGTGKAIAIAVSNDDVKKRHTGLLKWLIQPNRL